MTLCPYCKNIILPGNKNKPCGWCELIRNCPVDKNICRDCKEEFEGEDPEPLSLCDGCIEDRMHEMEESA